MNFLMTLLLSPGLRDLILLLYMKLTSQTGMNPIIYTQDDDRE